MSEFNDPSSATGVQWADLKDDLLLFTVHSLETDIETAYGKTDAVRADVVVVDGDGAGETYTDILVFPKVLQSQLRPNVGGKVLGRLGQGEAKKGQSAPWKLAAATDAEKAAAAKASIKAPASSDIPF